MLAALYCEFYLGFRVYYSEWLGLPQDEDVIPCKNGY